MVDTRKRTVLIVDDEPQLLELMSFWFDLQGFEVTAASDGQSAQQHLSRSAFDLLVLDLMMPDVDGKTLLRWLRQERECEMPVIITTGLNQPRVKDELQQLGANRLLTKPVPLPELERAVKELLSA